MALSPQTDLTRYLQEIRKFPMLELEQEQDLARRWQAKREPAAGNLLIGSHLRLVVKIAKGMGGYGVALPELIAEGNLGLMEAAQRFDPERGVRFATYAMWWIKAALHGHVMRNASIVRMGTTAAQKKLFYNLRRVKASHDEIGDAVLTPEAAETIAGEIGVTAAEVIDMDSRLGGGDQSLNTMVKSESETEWQDFLVDETPDQEIRVAENQELNQRRALMHRALGGLSPREQDILVQRRLNEDKVTLADLSEKYGVSRERIRQIEGNAFNKLRKAMLTEAPAAIA